jgi:hypothetical protein
MVVDNSEDWGIWCVHVVESYLAKFNLENIKRRSGKTVGLKATPQRTKCMILIGNPLGGNLVATFIFYAHMCVFK